MKRLWFYIMTMSLLPAVSGQVAIDSVEYDSLKIYRDSLENENLDPQMIGNTIFARRLSRLWSHEKLYPPQKQNIGKKSRRAQVFVSTKEVATNKKSIDEPRNNTEKHFCPDSIRIAIKQATTISIAIPQQQVIANCFLDDLSSSGVKAFIQRIHKESFNVCVHNIANIAQHYGMNKRDIADFAYTLADSLCGRGTDYIADSLNTEYIDYRYHTEYVQVLTFYLLNQLGYNIELGQAGNFFFIVDKDESFTREKENNKNYLQAFISINGKQMGLFIPHNNPLEGLLDDNYDIYERQFVFDSQIRLYSMSLNKQDDADIEIQTRMSMIDKSCKYENGPIDRFSPGNTWLLTDMFFNGVSISMNTQPAITTTSSLWGRKLIPMLYLDNDNRLNVINDGQIIAKVYTKIQNDTLFVAWGPLRTEIKNMLPAFVYRDNHIQSITGWLFLMPNIIRWTNFTQVTQNLLLQDMNELKPSFWDIAIEIKERQDELSSRWLNAIHDMNNEMKENAIQFNISLSSMPNNTYFIYSTINVKYEQ